MTEALYREDAYLRSCEAQVVEVMEDGSAVLDRTVFYATGGGQPGDRGQLRMADGGAFEVTGAHWGEGGRIFHRVEGNPPDAGSAVQAEIDWGLRHRRMRMHTAMHLLSVVLPYPVTGGSVNEEKSRLDFDMPDPPGDRDALQAALDALVAADHEVTCEWIGAAELDAQPELVKTVGVRPPADGGRVRLVRIGGAESPVDLQPCGGTHVRSTGEVGAARIGKIEKKGRSNRRVSLLLDD